MLTKNDVLTLRDLALEQLPKVRAMRDTAAQHSRRSALQAVAFSPLGTQYSPASTAVELQASRLLELVGKHPETHDEHLIDDIDDESLSITIEQALADAQRDRPKTETQLLEAARELCRLSGAALPAWMTVDVIAKRLTAPLIKVPVSPAPAAERSIRHKLRSNSLDVPIKKAISKAASLSTGAVFLQLRELALNGEAPFLGTIEGDALCYTNDKNQPAKLTKDALAKRLKSHGL